MVICSNCGHEAADHNVPVQNFWGGRCSIKGCRCKMELSEWREPFKPFNHETYEPLSLEEERDLPVGKPIT